MIRELSLNLAFAIALIISFGTNLVSTHKPLHAQSSPSSKVLITTGIATVDTERVGPAIIDPRNPIRQAFDGERLDLCSLQPIARPAAPELIDCSPEMASEYQHPIDRFLIAEWHRQGQTPSPPMERRAWLQRVHLDLTGLKPSYEDVLAFEADPTPDAAERWIDRLLSSPAYGEHWARLWMDVVRYSDSNGFDWDEFRKPAWRYRDFLARAFNHDMPFDEFITLQLAGDELVDGNPDTVSEQDALLATGYLRMGPYDNAAKLFNEQDRARVEVLADLTETTASAFLGLTMSCCRCHDHKTDPLTHADHYRLRAFFAATHFDDTRSIDLQADWEAWNQQDQQRTSQIAEQQSILEKLKTKSQPESDPNTPTTENKSAKSAAQKDAWKEQLTPEEQMEVASAEARIAELEAQRTSPQVALLMTDQPDHIDTIHILDQGDHRQPKQTVEPGFPSVLDPNPPDWVAPPCGRTTGRRLTLARWIASPSNPWTARVIANRVWQQLFGEGLVRTPGDFGISGAPPQHPELLDHLAQTLIDSGWSLKSLQRHITTSAAYRMQAMPESIPGTTPPETTAIAYASSRRTLRRMSAEQLRDSVLQVTGRLQHRNGGPPVWPELSPEILQANPAVLDDNETKTKGWYPSPPSEQSVRSLYLIQKRTLRLPWMETFDLPENTVSCPKRETSIVAPQSLSLLNAPWVVESATELAESSPSIEGLFRAILQRDPSPQETALCNDFLVRRTLRELALVLLNTNEFAFIP